MQKTFILKPKSKLGLQPVSQASCGQREVSGEVPRLVGCSQLGLLCGCCYQPALAAGPDDPLMFVIICRERSQLLLVLTRTHPAWEVPQMGSWGLQCLPAWTAVPRVCLALNGWSGPFDCQSIPQLSGQMGKLTSELERAHDGKVGLRKRAGAFGLFELV